MLQFISDMIAKPTSIAMLEVYSTSAGAVLQCDHRNRIVLHFAGSLTAFKVDAFLRLKQIVERIDLMAMASSTDRSSDVEVIYPVGCERVFVLTLPEVIALKELLEGAKVMLDLNSLLNERLNPVMA